MKIGNNLNAIKTFENGLNKNANNITNINTKGKDTKLVNEMIDMKKNENGIKVNTKVIQAKDDNVGTLLDIKK